MPHEMPASKAIINNPVLVNPNPAINSRHEIFMAILAEPLFQWRRNPYLVLHCNPSCNLDIFVRKLAVLPEMLFCKPEKNVNSGFRYFLYLIGFFKVFFWHFTIFFQK